MSPHEWKRIPDKRFPWLEVRESRKGRSYRVDYREGGIDLRRVLKPKDPVRGFRDEKEARAIAEELIYKERFGSRPKEKSQVRCDELASEIIKLKESKSPATLEQTRIFFKKHLLPFLEKECPYVADLNATVWAKYKNEFRLKNPKGALFNHWKFFVMLYRYANLKGILLEKHRLEFDEEREDYREEGLLIPDSDFQSMLRAASKLWRDRMFIQRFTGMRPGEVRHLRKGSVNFKTGVITLAQEETKTRTARDFTAPPSVLEVLYSRMAGESPYFFPNEKDPSKPMDKSLKGWHSALKRAGVNPDYTPHDLRHTYLTERFSLSPNPAIECFAAGLSIEEAQKTYLHFKAEHTASIATQMDERAKHFKASWGPL